MFINGEQANCIQIPAGSGMPEIDKSKSFHRRDFIFAIHIDSDFRLLMLFNTSYFYIGMGSELVEIYFRIAMCPGCLYDTSVLLSCYSAIVLIQRSIRFINA